MARGRWVSGRVVFGSLADFNAELTHFISRGALLLGGEGLPPLLEPFDFALTTPSGLEVPMRGRIVARAEGGALVQIEDFSDALLARIQGQALDPAGRGVEASWPGLSGEVAALPALPLSGELANPTRLEDLAALPLGPVPTAGYLERTSTVGLVRWLGARRATGWLVLKTDDEQRRWAVDKGTFLMASHEREAARAAFFWSVGRWELDPVAPERGHGRVPVTAWRLVLDALRTRIRDTRLDELRARIDLSLAARVGAAFLERSRSLELSLHEERTVKHDFDGRRPLSDSIAAGAIGEPSLLRLVVLLEILGLVELAPPAA